MTWVVISLLVLGAFAAVGTLLHTFALAVDVAIADLLFNRIAVLTLSSYAGIWARFGKPLYALAIGFIFLSWPPFKDWLSLAAWRPALLRHGEDAMSADISRSCDSLQILLARDPHALVLIAALRQRNPNP